MVSKQKVGIITGGSSGIGLAVSEALAAKDDWTVAIFDLNSDRGSKEAERIGATFHHVDVTNYSSLANAFKDVFKTHRRLDFVHANAGIVGSGDFYETHDTGDEPPPPPSTSVVDIDLISVMNTTYLAQHYFRQTPRDDLGPRSLIITSSCGGLYGTQRVPNYGAAKFGTVGWTRSIAGHMWRVDGIRVNVSPMKQSRPLRINLLTA
jgi:NAD(P)-dependent dehydrogenase (short-subunit alcohol dehydrogenase family)